MRVRTMEPDCTGRLTLAPRMPRIGARIAITTRLGLAASISVHLALAALMTLHGGPRGGAAAPGALEAMIIVRSPVVAASSPEPAAVAASASPAIETVAPTPPKPKPKADARAPKPRQPEVHTAADRLPPADVSQPPASAGAIGESTPKAGAEDESPLPGLLDGVRGNWLQPAGPRAFFRCRIRIDYRAGGIIASVNVLQGCGSSPLDDSVLRAVWKTQPLPLDPQALRSAGSVELDFTP